MKYKVMMLFGLVALASCGGDDPVKPEAKGEAGKEFPAALMAEAAPDGAVSVVEAREKGKAGEAIVLRGKVGGKMTPISEGVAIFVLADETAIKSCDQTEDDECETPWDFCCEVPEKILASTLTVQVRGEDGKVVRAGMRGLAGLKELSHLVISGTVDEASTDEFMIVNAEKIFVEKP